MLYERYRIITIKDSGVIAQAAKPKFDDICWEINYFFKIFIWTIYIDTYIWVFQCVNVKSISFICCKTSILRVPLNTVLDNKKTWTHISREKSEDYFTVTFIFVENGFYKFNHPIQTSNWHSVMALTFKLIVTLI